ncbi:hypothetical protein ABMA27_012207 [Loxostege sticticalis]|uniref:C2H2-type domain-containing protein n=1 Tax=Loxostege sticticalis TaxID=481309 RepID=A0ABR3H0I7_LOXSC
MPRSKKNNKHAVLDPLSSLNKYFICNCCEKKFKRKNILRKHVTECEEKHRLRLKKLTCRWCNVVFKNLANLASHAQKLHNDNLYTVSDKEKPEKCNVCFKTFTHMFQLRTHIRRYHFNLKAKIPYCYQKKVNQVWFERVRNSNNVMEIRKKGPNTLVMRKLDDNTAIKVAEQETEEIDLTKVYPTDTRQDVVKCKLCSKKYKKRNLKKHMEEVHYNKRKYDCNNCKTKFKRLYQFLKHRCQRIRKIRGVKQISNDIIISSYESLAVVKT